MVAVFLFFLAASPTFEEAFRSGLLALQNNDLAAAESSLESAARLAPANGRVWIALAQTYWKLHDRDRAEAAAKRAETLAPADPVVRQSLTVYRSEICFENSQPLLERQQFAEAIGALEPCEEMGSAQVELALGVAYYGLRRFDEAAATFLRTIEIAPGIDQPYLFLGKMLDQAPGRLPEITKRFAEYEAAHPASATGYLLHARALDAQSIEPETAAKLLRKAISIDANDASAHFEWGVLLDGQKQFADAAREFERAAALDPADAATHYRLARDYDRLGKHDAAQTERERHDKLVRSQDPLR